MTLDDLDEAVAILGTMITTLQASVPSAVGRPGSAFRYACGDLLASAAIQIPGATVFTDLENCFDLAVAAGASLIGMDAVRSASLAVTPIGQAGCIVAGMTCCYALTAEVQILASTTFASSNDVMTALAAIQTAFDVALEWTADNRMPALYQALLAACAAATRDLTARAAPLPRLTTYSFPRGTTSHALAYRLYGDASRCDELRAENQVIAPAFMPASGTALSE